MSDSIDVSDPDYNIAHTDINAGQVEYDFPEDFGSLVRLSVAVPYEVNGRKIVLLEPPAGNVANGIEIYYKPTAKEIE